MLELVTVDGTPEFVGFVTFALASEYHCCLRFSKMLVARCSDVLEKKAPKIMVG
jgi:hypothetical protein